MDGNKQQKTIPTVHNLSSSKGREVLWALEELADAGIKYNVVNLRRGRADTYKVLKFEEPPVYEMWQGRIGRAPLHVMKEPIEDEAKPHVILPLKAEFASDRA